MMRLDSEFAYPALRGRRHRFASGNGWYYGCQGLVPGVAVLRPYETFTQEAPKAYGVRQRKLPPLLCPGFPGTRGREQGPAVQMPRGRWLGSRQADRRARYTVPLRRRLDDRCESLRSSQEPVPGVAVLPPYETRDCG